MSVPIFETYQQRDEWIKDHADYFTVVRYLGPRVGYERHEVKSFSEAEALAGRMSEASGRIYLIYAVCGIRDAFIKKVDPPKQERKRTNE